MIAFVNAAAALFTIRATANGSQTEAKQRFRARIAYDGTKYHGWQYQTDVPTIQAELEIAVSRKVSTPIRVVGASRTDTGVHSRGQGVHFDIPIQNVKKGASDLLKFQFTLNQLLPRDIRISHIENAPPVAPYSQAMSDFLNSQRGLWNAIYCAKGKLYSYRFCAAHAVDPLQRHYRYHEWRASRKGFSEARLREAAARFVGSHDFTAFTNTSMPPPGILPPVLINPIRTIHYAEVIDEGNGMFKINFSIDGAMYRMIRNIVGTILNVAVGKLDISEIDLLFESRDRRLVPKSAPALGLCLEEVYYDDWKL